jgi:MFS superfamily sulfate permease-like transporter
VLVVTGWKLVSVSHVRHLFMNHGWLPAAIWVVTFVLVVAEDLLTGVLVGLAMSLLELLPHFRKLRLRVDTQEDAQASRISLNGAATFVTLPKVNRALESVPVDRPIQLDMENVPAMDHTSAETLRDWIARMRKRGVEVIVSGSAKHLQKLQPA